MNFFLKLAKNPKAKDALNIFCFSSFLALSACSKELCQTIRKVVDNELKDVESLAPSSTMIAVNLCEACRCSIRAHVPINYMQDNPPRRIIIICRKKWKCRFHALFSRGRDSAINRNIYLLRPLVDPDAFVSIPRSSGNRSESIPRIPNIIKFPKREDIGPCSEFIWTEGIETFTKMAQIEHCYQIPRDLPPQEDLALEKCIARLNEDVVAVIKGFLTYPKKLQPVFHSWGALHGSLYQSKYKNYIKNHTLC